MFHRRSTFAASVPTVPHPLLTLGPVHRRTCRNVNQRARHLAAEEGPRRSRRRRRRGADVEPPVDRRPPFDSVALPCCATRLHPWSAVLRETADRAHVRIVTEDDVPPPGTYMW